MVTQEYLKDHFEYHPETGIFYRRMAHGRMKQITSKCHWGYLRTRIDGRSYKLHRLAWVYMHGEMPTMLDHINGVKDDNRISNLRRITPTGNMRNAKMYNTNTSGNVGVYFNKRWKRWYAQIKVDGKEIHLGYFSNKQDAIKAREKANKKYNFHENHGRQHQTTQ